MKILSNNFIELSTQINKNHFHNNLLKNFEKLKDPVKLSQMIMSNPELD